MAQSIVCSGCGSKIRASRQKCPRCRAVIAAPDPRAEAAASRKLLRAAGILVAAFALLVLVLWFRRGPASVSAPAARSAPADPLMQRRAGKLPAQDVAAAPTSEGTDRPFLDPDGRGAVAYGGGDYGAALAQYQAAVERNPRDAESLSNLGQVLVRLNRAEEALAYFQRALEIVPDRWSYQFNLARALGLVNRTAESIAAYRKAQQLFPDDYVTTFNLALTLHKSGDDAGAVEQYRKAIALQPDDASFRLALGNSLVGLDKRSEAAAAYEEYLRLSPSAPDADKVRARIAVLTGAPDVARGTQGSSQP